MLPPSHLSRAVVARAARTVPYPLLGDNTLVLSDGATLARTRDGGTALMFRVGDTYPNQHVEACVKAYLYRGGGGGGGAGPRARGGAPPRGGPPTPPFASGEPDDYDVIPLDVGYGDGSDRLMLWLPVVVKHRITAASPLAGWLARGGLLADADACIAVTVEGYRYSTAANSMRMRVYNVLRDVRCARRRWAARGRAPRAERARPSAHPPPPPHPTSEGHSFVSIVTAPSESRDHRPRVNWAAFHDTAPIPGSGPAPLPPGLLARPPSLRGPARGVAEAGAAPAAPEAAAPHGATAPALRAAAPPPPSSSPPRLRRDSMDALRADAGAAGRAAGSPAPAASAAPPEGGGGMLIPPALDPDSTFRLRAVAARARLDAALFEQDSAAAAAAREGWRARRARRGASPEGRGGDDGV